MKLSIKRVMLILISVLQLLTFSGCSPTNAPTSDTETEAEGFSLLFLPLPDGVALSTTQYCEGDKIYIGGLNLSGAPVFGCYSNDRFSIYELPDDIQYVYACHAWDEGSAILAGDYPQFWRDVNDNTHVNENENKSLSIVLYDKDGTVVSRKALIDEQEGGRNYTSVRFYEGKYYLLSAHRFVQVDKEGLVLNSLQLDNSRFLSQCLTEKGLTVCVFWSSADGGDNATKLQLLNPDTFQFQTVFSNAELSISGLGYAADGSYLLNANGVLLTLGSDSRMKDLFSLSSLGAAQLDYTDIYPYDSGFFVAMRNQHYLTRITYGMQSDDRQILRLWATVNSPAVVGLVERFNQNNDAYRIKIEYLRDMTQEQSSAMIASGEGPDIYAMLGMDMFENVSHGMAFEDLSPLLANDGVYDSGVLLPSLLDACEEEGALYLIPIDFMIWTFCARRDMFPHEQANLTEILKANTSNDIHLFSAQMGRADLWYWISNLYLNDHLDNASKRFDFQTEEFRLLLECCAQVSESEGALDDSGILRFEQIPGILRLEYLHKLYGTNYTINTSLGSAFSIQQSLAISAQSKNKDGAWQFIREALSSNFPQSSELCLPATVDRFDALIAQGMNGTLQSPIAPIKITEHEEAELKKIVNTTSVLIDEYPTVIQVMKEEAERYFAGIKSAEDTIAAIQSRVNLIMAEMYD